MLPITALLTDMDQPLADTAGNALEVEQAVRYLSAAAASAALRAAYRVGGRRRESTDVLREEVAYARRR